MAQTGFSVSELNTILQIALGVVGSLFLMVTCLVVYIWQGSGKRNEKQFKIIWIEFDKCDKKCDKKHVTVNEEFGKLWGRHDRMAEQLNRIIGAHDMINSKKDGEETA